MAGVTATELLPETTLTDVVLEIRRIADVIAPRPPQAVRRDGCGEQHEGATCALDDRHKGPHASGDGQTRWVDE